jgi:nucleotide-binding universal stress UspA family protein
MTGKSTEIASAGAAEPIVAAPVEITSVVAFLDGSPFAERALPTARWVADRLGAVLRLVEVASTEEAAENAQRYLGAVARREHAAGWDAIKSDDVAAALAETVASPAALGCLASHGRDRSAALVGSVAAAVLDRSRDPMLLAGPRCRPVGAADAPVVVAVDGTSADEAVVGSALGWAARLDRRLLVVTVAEPAPPPYREGGARRARGPADPEAYLAGLADRAGGSGRTVDTQVVYDPVSVRDGLVPVLDRTAALVVLGTHHRHGVARIVMGSQAARIVHDTTVPALVVPATPASTTPTPS